jgi:hypothetical protein
MLSLCASVRAFVCIHLFVTFKPLAYFLEGFHYGHVLEELLNAANYNLLQYKNVAYERNILVPATLKIDV